MPTRPPFLPLALCLFTASGFAGLIYESIWSHYLKLLLGHAAYAQTLVLAMFMGGMALGAWLASRVSSRWRDPLLAYAFIEAAIGAASLAFHDVFVGATGFAFDHIIPGLGSGAAIQAFKWSLAGLLILPQSVLLGMTFPLMTAGVLRVRPRDPGYTVAMLYFTNSLGAAVGVLASGFYFIPEVGLPGALLAAGIVNLAVAASIMLLKPSTALAPGAPRARPAAAPGGPAIPGVRLLLAVSCLTGLSSFMYEIGWIRMLSLVLGSSTHAFELMLSAFILGLAFGGLWIRRRIDAARDPLLPLGWVQLAMGVAALATLPLYASSFRMMELAMESLSRTESGYVAFNFVSHGLALLVMFPAAFCAGMTLPLITASLLRRAAGERAIGQVYASNTAGAIAGVVVAVHLGLPFLGLKGIIVAGAAVDLALGIALLAAAGGRSARSHAALAGIASAAVLFVATFNVRLDAGDMASGVFRHGVLPRSDQRKVELQIDGKTATVSLVRTSNQLALLTNGKSDGAVRTDGDGFAEDEIMMGLLGALPQFLDPGARRVATIGFGTGMTTHTLLASPRIEAIDTIEIEPAMVRAAAAWRRFNARALVDPRSHGDWEDAKTFFSSQQTRYDVIVSEPSNPWVSGVSSLFSTEFYRDVRRSLKDGGLLLQWVQAYEMTPALLGTILRALQDNFADFELWMPSQADLIIVASHNGRVPALDPGAFDNPILRAELARFRILNVDDLRLHRFGGSAALSPFFASFGAPVNSDFQPFLDLKAPQARFMGAHVGELLLLHEAGFPVLELFDEPARLADTQKATPGPRPWLSRSGYVDQARAVASYLETADERSLGLLPSVLANDAVLVRAIFVDCRMSAPPGTARDALAGVAWLVNQHLSRTERTRLWSRLSANCGSRSGPAVRKWLRLHSAVAAGDPQGMMDAASALLDSGEPLSADLTARVVAPRLAGLILANQPAAAQREFARYRGHLGSAPSTRALFRFLVAQADQGSRVTESAVTKFDTRVTNTDR